MVVIKQWGIPLLVMGEVLYANWLVRYNQSDLGEVLGLDLVHFLCALS